MAQRSTLHTAPTRLVHALLRQLMAGDDHDTPAPLQPAENARLGDLAAWLLATQPPGLITAACGDGALRVGLAHHGGLVLLDQADPAPMLWCAGLADPAIGALTEQIGRWRAAGRPGVRYTLGCTKHGWQPRAEVNPSDTTRRP